MKYIYIALLTAVLACSFVSCNDKSEEEPSWNRDGVIYDFGPIEFFIEANEGENDLLDPSYDNNICNKISVTYNGQTYFYTPPTTKMKLRHYNAEFKGLQLKTILLDPETQKVIYTLVFGEFDYTKKYKNECFYINWPDGKKDKVTWSHRLVYDNGVKAIGDIYLNGKVLESPFVCRAF